MPRSATASLVWQHEVISLGVLLVVGLVAIVAGRVYKLRHSDSHPRPSDEQNPVLRGLGQVAEWLLLLWPW